MCCSVCCLWWAGDNPPATPMGPTGHQWEPGSTAYEAPPCPPHWAEPTAFTGAWLVAKHLEVLLWSELQHSPRLPVRKCHKVEQRHLRSFLILLFTFLCASTSLTAELTVVWWGSYNSVFFKCKNSQCCPFGDSVFNNAIFLQKSTFSHMENFTCVSPEATANLVSGYMFSCVQNLKKNTLTYFFLIFLFPCLASFGSLWHICPHPGHAGDPDTLWRAGLLIPTLFFCYTAPWK